MHEGPEAYTGSRLCRLKSLDEGYVRSCAMVSAPGVEFSDLEVVSVLKFPGYQSIRRLFAALLLLIVTCASAMASMGLGEARVESFLGQPLAVRITLLDPTPEALDSFAVDIASAEDHARLGVPVDALALGLRAEIDTSVNPPVLMVRSARPVNEPLLQLLVSARWSGGRMLREYTLFLDPVTAPVAPPIRRREPAPTAPPARTEPRQAAPVPPPREVAPPPEERVAPPASAVPSEDPAPQVQDQSMTVRSGQTLWAIASDWRPDDSVSMSQVMLAILERNPDAFTDANINRLRRGAQLVRPDMASMRATAPGLAEQRVREQNRAWREAQGISPVPPAPPPEPLAQAPVIETPSSPEIETEPALEPDVPPATEISAQDEVDPAASADSDRDAVVETTEVLPRLELIAAEDDLLADAESLAAERERLEQELQGLLQVMDSDDLGTAQTDLAVDQIRQAIESGDAGGLMVASEGLASLEQQLREARLEREQRAAERAAAPPPPAPIPTDDLGARLPGWLLPAAAALGLLLVLGLLGSIVMRRRRASDDSAQRSHAVASAPVATPTPESKREPKLEPEPDPVESTPSAPAPAPTDRVDAGLAALYEAAEDEDFDRLSTAFSQLHEEVDSTDDPRWREAVTLTRLLIPDHPLLSKPPEIDEPDLPAEVAEDGGESELMAMLEGGEDEDETPDDEPLIDEALDDERERVGDDGHPDLARVTNRLDPHESSSPSAAQKETDLPDGAEASKSEPTALDLDFEFSALPDDEADSAEEVPPSLDPEPESDADKLRPVSEQAPPELQLSSELSLDETEADSEDEPPDWFGLEQTEVDESASGDAGTDDEYRDQDSTGGMSDDDAEVKLDLARAYLSMDDWDSARALLEEVQAEGSESHQAIAQQLLDKLK